MNDGGQAFPGSAVFDQNRMMVEHAGAYVDLGGMSLRDWFAGMAMQGIHAGYTDGYPEHDSCAKRAYQQADAMLAERNKETNTP